MTSALTASGQPMLPSLVCKICDEMYDEGDKEPRVLPLCQHTVCSQCLKSIIANARKTGQMKVPCPYCRTPCEAADNVDKVYLKNFALMEVLADFKKTELTAAPKSSSVCPKHPPNLLQLYCSNCRIPICQLCLIPEHQTHKFGLLAEETKPLRTQLISKLPALKQRHAEISQVVVAAKEQLRVAQEENTKKRLQYHEIITNIVAQANSMEASVLNECDAVLRDNVGKFTAALNTLMQHEAAINAIESELNTLNVAQAPVQPSAVDVQLFSTYEETMRKTSLALDSPLATPPTIRVEEDITEMRRKVEEAFHALKKLSVKTVYSPPTVVPPNITISTPSRVAIPIPQSPIQPHPTPAPVLMASGKRPNLQGSYQEYIFCNRHVVFFKVDPRAPLTQLFNFAEERNLQWFQPRNAQDMQKVIEFGSRLGSTESWYCQHSWIVLYGLATDPNNRRIAGFDVKPVVDDEHGNHTIVSTCPGGKNTFCAVRKLSCSFGNPSHYQTTRCWDTDHGYDWLVCEYTS
ncbi:tripartite motif-containing protein 59 [Pelomyxa schiedti]|nr:tripartite motif-containing protein 59 [Pelomyxa schiedti]